MIRLRYGQGLKLSQGALLQYPETGLRSSRYWRKTIAILNAKLTVSVRALSGMLAKARPSPVTILRPFSPVLHQFPHARRHAHHTHDAKGFVLGLREDLVLALREMVPSTDGLEAEFACGGGPFRIGVLSCVVSFKGR